MNKFHLIQEEILKFLIAIIHYFIIIIDAKILIKKLKKLH